MIKALIGLLIAAIVAAFIRAVIAMISKEVTQMVNPDQPKSAPQDPPNPQQSAGTSTPLKKCLVCGTYSPAERLVLGQYCSDACASKAS